MKNWERRAALLQARIKITWYRYLRARCEEKIHKWKQIAHNLEATRCGEQETTR